MNQKPTTSDSDDSPGSDVPVPGVKNGEKPQHSTLAELRSLLVAPEQEDLRKVESRLQALEQRKTSVSTDNLTELLPAAVVARSKRDNKLAAALEPTVEETLRGSIQRNPKSIVEAIFPIIGPAIRRAISEALSATMDSVNRTMEHQFSLQGVRWRLEAFRTGQSFSDVVLAKTLLFAVEQIFVIDNETGLPLVHVSRDPEAEHDSAVVTGMLSVVHDFVRDSLGADSGDFLESVEFGDLNIWIEPGPAATLAAVIRGTPPRSLRERFQSVIERFHEDYHDELQQYRGDTSFFSTAIPDLSVALDSRYAQKEGGAWKTRIAGLVVVAVLSAIIVTVAGTRFRWNRLVERIDDEPGIVVTDSGRESGRWFIGGLRDPLAADVSAILKESKFSNESVSIRLEPYLTSAPEVVVVRSRQFLDAPPSIHLKMNDGILSASGSATNTWITQARERAKQFFAIAGYSDEAVEDLSLTAILDRITAIETDPIEFDAGSAVPRSTEHLSVMAVEVQSVLAALEEIGRTGQVVVFGSSSSDGDPVMNRRLANSRAASVQRALQSAGLNAQIGDSPGDVRTDGERRVASIRVFVR